MARNDALLKITKTLLARRNELRKRLGMDLNDLGGANAGSGDAADAAFGATGGELSSQLAQMESRELSQIELALVRLKQGRYGICDVCEKRIPVGRLNVVPYSVMCVKCQTQAEKDGNWLTAHAQFNWSDVRDEASERDMDYTSVQSEMGK
jgi:DnaK suppressor protein